MSNARFAVTLRLNATAGVAQNSPTLMPDTAKRGIGRDRQVAATSWQPAAVAMPCTRAITGTGNARIASITRLHCANSVR